VTTFAYTGSVQSYTVPAGATYVTIECWGAQGSSQSGAEGGNGGYAKGRLIVAPGTVLNVYVGGYTSTNSPGWNGGGAGGSSTAGGTYWGGGGGGASDVRRGGSSLSNRVIVAGGGGGRSTTGSGYGGTGGGASGGQGGKGPYAVAYGDPGSQTKGYALGTGGPGLGGTTRGGGGGGGGYYGGDGGHNGSDAGGTGGNGGSGFLSSALVSGATMSTGVRAGNGQVVITTLNVAPLAPTLSSPPNNGYIISTEANAFGWAFNDTDPGDSQSRADFRYKQNPGDAWTTVTNAATTAGTYTLPASTWAVGKAVEWQVATWDKNGAAGPWSGSRFVNTIASVPAPTITNPTAWSDQFSTPVEVDWTLPAGFTQDAYRVQRVSYEDWDVVYYDSGIISSSALTALVPLDAAAGRTDVILVTFRYFGHWSDQAFTPINNQFGPPNRPLLVLAQVPGKPVVVITITNPPSSEGFADTLVTDLYRDGTRIASNLANNSTFTDLLAGAGDVEYTAIAFAASGGSAESY
jgi:hypothetical protein